ncbi:peptide/nickel transport system permease protein [Kytococcus aerolatus]|uniref:Peptide/nickel transport system permease protein n=1 Tax=Kytococcus aerolatus TaxID=592308 RepID=A0A212T8D4_9MICO|nr:ABC transporter permease [Kytococcus aerolatus]SNC62120.1 peptide/nickel transport system permease protein [Kytococcus aerolatus]
MIRFIVRRLLQMVLVLLALSLLLFFWLRSLPGGPVSALLGDRATPATRKALEEQLGLDQPLPMQYVAFVQRAASGDFGVSTGIQPGTPVTQIFVERLPATIELSALAITLAVVAGVPLGYLAARRRGGWFDNLSVMSSLVGVAVPVFFLAYVLRWIFALELGWLPVSGRQDASIDATHITNFFVLDGIMTQEWDAAWDALKHLVLPALALASIPFAVIFRITRASVLDVLDEDYVRTAQSKGLAARTIRGRHVLRNALIPVITVIGLQVGALLAGAVLTEKVFSIAGVGNALAEAFTQRDYAMLQLLIMAAASIYVLVNLVVDILYAVVDPRVRTR